MTQLELHEKIEKFFKAGVGSAGIKAAQELLVNEDAKCFFFSQADDAWIEWLWQHGFLDGLKNKAEDLTSILYRLPELDYLTRMAEKDPAMVAKIMLDSDTATKEDNLNPEVVYRFIWILGSLSFERLLPEQALELMAKIHRDKWVYSLRAFRETGYRFEGIIKKLVEAKEGDAILELAEALLMVKSKAEILEKTASFSLDDPFYVTDLDASGIFEALANIPDVYKEKAFQVTTSVLGEVVKLTEADEAKVFDYTDLFALCDVDIFTLEIENKPSYSHREDIKNLAATIKKLIERTIGKQCANADEAGRLFGYIDRLPSCQSTWRLKLFALAQCPYVFKEELKEALFRLFAVDSYYEIEGGTEYKKALKIAFPYLPDPDQREYVKNVFSYFSKKAEKDPDKIWIKRIGWEILSSIPQDNLSEGEKKDCEKYFDKRPDQKYEPEPSIGKTRSGSVNPRSPVNLDDFTVDQIIENLKTEWTANKLSEQFKNDDFLNPRGVEGLGDALKENIKKRTGEYLRNVDKFFDRDHIHPHYMYSLLRGIAEMLRNKQSLSLEQIGQLFGLFEIIRKDGELNPFKRRDDKSWLTDWIEVHMAITDILRDVIADEEIKDQIHKSYREQIINLISYLFTIKDSPSEEHEKPEYGEPYGIAINSVRGRAYEAFVIFTENDGKTLAKDVKKIFEQVLTDNSMAVRFVVGRYLASFYFRDKEFIVKLLAEIFPKDNPDKKDVYLASWEGYLSNTLYDKLFIELKDYYGYAIALDPNGYTQRKYLKGLDESLAIHLALAFAHLGLEIDNPLFVQFWSTPNVKRHQEFISFIGRSCLTRSQAGEEWLMENKVSKEKLIKFWDWALEHVSEPEALAGFGFWVNPDKEVLDEAKIIERMAQTLKKSDGDIDWDYGLIRRLPSFAKENGEKTFEIIRHFLLNSNDELNRNRHVPFMDQGEIKDALSIIYDEGDKDMKQKVTNLINTLIEKGSSMFWGLKEVIRECDGQGGM